MYIILHTHSILVGLLLILINSSNALLFDCDIYTMLCSIHCNVLLQDTRLMKSAGTSSISEALRSVVVAIFGLVLMFITSVLLTALTLAILPILLLSFRWFAIVNRKYTAEQLSASAEASTVAEESFGSIRTVRCLFALCSLTACVAMPSHHAEVVCRALCIEHADASLHVTDSAGVAAYCLHGLWLFLPKLYLCPGKCACLKSKIFNICY